MKRGIVYVAWGSKWINEAVRSSQMAKAIGYSTCLLTDEVHNTGEFDIVRQVDFSIFDGMHYFMKKWACLIETPFESTCFIDTDTYIHQQIDLGFDLAEQFGLAMTHSPGMLFHYEGREHIHYNGGIMFFSGQRPELLQQFCDVGRELEGSGLVGDEPIFSVAFRRHGLNPCVLPTVFNTIRAGQIHTRQIKVYHSRNFPANQLVSDQFGNDFPVWKNS